MPVATSGDGVMPSRVLAVFILAVLIAVTPVAAARAADDPAGLLLSLINRYRAASGLTPLASDATLDEVARRHGEDMATRAFFAHVTPEGGGLGDRLWNAGYRFTIAAENLARGYRDAKAVLAGWQGSPGHQANLLRNDVSAAGIGIAAAAGPDRQPVWVLVLARPQPN